MSWSKTKHTKYSLSSHVQRFHIQIRKISLRMHIYTLLKLQNIPLLLPTIAWNLDRVSHRRQFVIILSNITTSYIIFTRSIGELGCLHLCLPCILIYWVLLSLTTNSVGKKTLMFCSRDNYNE